MLVLRGCGQRGRGGQRAQQPLGAPEGEGLRAERLRRRARQADQRLQAARVCGVHGRQLVCGVARAGGGRVPGLG